VSPEARKPLSPGVKLALASVAVVVLVSLGAALAFTANSAFFTRYRGLNREYATLQASAHTGIACRECHDNGQSSLTYETALIGEFYRGLAKTGRMPAFVRFDKPSNSACRKCHIGDWSHDAKRTSRVPHPAHLQVATEKRECVSCHKWTAHQEAYMSKHRKMPFSGVCVSFGCHVGWKQPDQCATCHHQLKSTAEQWKQTHPQTVRATGANSCLETCHDIKQCRLCHTTGQTPKFSGLTAQPGMQAIEVLHVRSDWLSVHGRQALLDQSKCLVCHVSIGECQSCHAQRPAFHGSVTTWIGTHKKFGKDKPRCLECHKEPWCNKCHAQFKEMR
jgi:hypothetical protein